MIAYVAALLAYALAALLAVPAVCDAWAWLRGRFKRSASPSGVTEKQRILFLVPAHNEELLIDRCVKSLCGQDYPSDLMTVLVVADNCKDATARVASAAGAVVLERSSTSERGKGHAIGWALGRVALSEYSAVIIVDADTIVEPDYAQQLMRWAPLEERVLQTFDGLSNEFETWLTRLAGLLTRNRYEIALPLKAAAGLNCPLTGDGVLIGTRVLSREPWRVRTITEGWELYAKYTLSGQAIDYAPASRLYAQETRSLRQAGTQRTRWTSGRFAVLNMYWRQILAAPIPVLQKLDLFAELTYPGPIIRMVLGLVGAGAVLALKLPGGYVAAGAMLTAFLQPAVYSLRSLARHPEPGRTLIAFLQLPTYALWRIGITVRAVLLKRSEKWVRTAREIESVPETPR